MEQLLELLQGIRPDVDFENEKALVDDGILDSFDIVSIISEIDDIYGVQIRITELDPVNFNSAEAIWNLTENLPMMKIIYISLVQTIIMILNLLENKLCIYWKKANN